MSVAHDITEEALQLAGYRTLHAGDDYDYTFTVTRGGAALDLTGATIWLTVKERAVESDAQAKLQLSTAQATEISVTDPATGGVFVVHFQATATKDLEGLWLYDIQVKLASEKILTVATGKIEFLPNITRATS